ncbi:MAG: arsenate reductase [Chitinophagaceae bacterium]|nr:MAG: arsenate reductase [Chitinophagaceae bacterium]
MATNAADIFPSIDAYLKLCATKFETIPQSRKLALDELSNYIQQKLTKKQPVQLTFICTHNSRRSHFGQIWAQTAAAYYGVSAITCSVNTLRLNGFVITTTDNSSNPHYQVQYSNQHAAIDAFSKKYTDAPNPNKDYAAVLTCSHADETCPIVFGAEARLKIMYEDPKISDGTPQQEAVYKERSQQIATEMLYVFSSIKQ